MQVQRDRSMFGMAIPELKVGMVNEAEFRPHVVVDSETKEQRIALGHLQGEEKGEIQGLNKFKESTVRCKTFDQNSFLGRLAKAFWTTIAGYKEVAIGEESVLVNNRSLEKRLGKELIKKDENSMRSIDTNHAQQLHFTRGVNHLNNEMYPIKSFWNEHMLLANIFSGLQPGHQAELILYFDQENQRVFTSDDANSNLYECNVRMVRLANNELRGEITYIDSPYIEETIDTLDMQEFSKEFFGIDEDRKRENLQEFEEGMVIVDLEKINQELDEVANQFVEVNIEKKAA